MCSKNYLCKIEFRCEHNATRRSTDKEFKDGKLHQSGTIVIQDIISHSRKGRSRSTYNKIANTDLPKNKDGLITSLQNGRKPGQKNRSYTCCPISKESKCPVKFTVFCDKISKRWFLSSPKDLNNLQQDECCRLCSHNHMRLHPADLCTDTKDLSQDVQEFITNSFNSGCKIQHIIDMVKAQFGINVSEEQIQHKRKNYIDDMIKLTNGETKDNIQQLSAAEKLIYLFENMNDVSFVYVKHHIDSGFVTYTKDRHHSTNKQVFSDEENSSLAHEIKIGS